jgi:hypothetical protein
MKTFVGNSFVSKFLAYSSSMILVLLLGLAPLSVHAEPYRCDVSGDDRLGLEEAIYLLQYFSGAFIGGSHEVLDCGEPHFEITESGNLGMEAKRYILCRMNEIRSQVALGTISDDGTNGAWPVATNMKRMQWDENLATVAQNYADECNYAHNSSRGTDYATLTGLSGPAVGENIAARWSSATTDSANALAALESAFTGWNGENDLWHYDTINTSSWDSGFGHFTQHVWADTTRVGCGQAWCLDGGWNMVFTVCNFYTAGNYWNRYPYESGSEVCTEDYQAGDTCENGLITPADYREGLGFECDVDGDNALGLEELIEALKIISGHLN